MTSTVDWQTIRAEYEAGASKQALSIKHGITRQAIIKHARKEHWIARLVTSPKDIVTGGVTPAEDDDKESDVAILAQVRYLIAQRLEQEPENKDIKMLMDSFSQVKKLELLTAAEQNTSAYGIQEFLAKCTPEELTIIKPVLNAVAARDKALEEQEKLMKKTG